MSRQKKRRREKKNERTQSEADRTTHATVAGVATLWPVQPSIGKDDTHIIHNTHLTGHAQPFSLTSMPASYS